MGLYAHPIYSETGDYPDLIRRIIDKNSLEQGFLRSRLPYFSDEQVSGSIYVFINVLKHLFMDGCECSFGGILLFLGSILVFILFVTNSFYLKRLSFIYLNNNYTTYLTSTSLITVCKCVYTTVIKEWYYLISEKPFKRQFWLLWLEPLHNLPDVSIIDGEGMESSVNGPWYRSQTGPEPWLARARSWLADGKTV